MVASKPPFSLEVVHTAPSKDRSRKGLFLGFHLGHFSSLGHISVPSGLSVSAPSLPLLEAASD